MMRKSSFVFIFVCILTVSPMAFPQAQQQKPPEEPLLPLAVPKDYRYNARGRRDPFVNPIPKPVAPAGGGNTAAAPRPVQPQCQQGLKGVLVAQVTISGIVTSKEPSMNVAIIGGPGNKTYFARVGDALCDAVVKSIKLDAVTFLVTAGVTDQRPSREIVRELRPKPPGENK
jgi:Tfp pilus assembly protein PilP